MVIIFRFSYVINFPLLPVNVSRYGDAKWCHRDHPVLCLFSVANVLFFPCIFNPPPTTILHPVFNNVPDIFLHDCGNLGKAKIKRRFHDYSVTCVLLSDSTREAETNIPRSTWQTLPHHGVRLTIILQLQYHVWTGMNILISCFILNSHIFWETWWFTGKFQCHYVEWLAKTSTS